MWYAAVLRFIRRRLVLAIIFLLSLTYCLVNLLGNGSQLLLDVDDFEVKRDRPIIWQSDKIDNDTNALLTQTCRNSVQGKALIVDDRGYVCHRPDIHQLSGCCNVEAKTTQRYSCETCNVNRCCMIYEHCASCCLNPNKKSILEEVLAKASGRQIAVFASVRDQFELCLSKCRTDSHSVQHENKYRDPKLKYCYGLTEAHESQRETIIDGNIVGQSQTNNVKKK